MGADGAVTGSNAGRTGGTATASAANPDDAASSAAGQFCILLPHMRLDASRCVCLTLYWVQPLPTTTRHSQNRVTPPSCPRLHAAVGPLCGTALQNHTRGHLAWGTERRHFLKHGAASCCTAGERSSPCKCTFGQREPDMRHACCAAAARHSAEGSAAAAGRKPSVAASASSKGAATASSSAHDVSSAAAANKFSGRARAGLRLTTSGLTHAPFSRRIFEADQASMHCIICVCRRFDSSLWGI